MYRYSEVNTGVQVVSVMYRPAFRFPDSFGTADSTWTLYFEVSGRVP